MTNVQISAYITNDFIGTLAGLFGSVIKALEVLYVLEGIKPAARFLAKESELASITRHLEEWKLHPVISDYGVLKDKNSGYSDASVVVFNAGEEPEHLNRILYISLKKELSEAARAAEGDADHLKLGEILGYPGCCSAFFLKHFSFSHTDLTGDCYHASSGIVFPFQNNILMRHIDCSLLSHFPHSFDCNKSLKQAKERLSLIEKYDPDLAWGIEFLQKRGVLFFERNISILSDVSLKSGEISFSSVFALVGKDFGFTDKSFLVKDKDTVQSKNEEIRGHALLFI